MTLFASTAMTRTSTRDNGLPIPDESSVSADDELILALPLRRIDIPDDWRAITPRSIEEMAESIREVGLLQPIGVVAADGGRFTLCFGHTRLLATRALGRTTIKARVFVVEDDEHRQIMTDVENIRRTRLQPAEEVRAIGRWRDWYVRKHPDSQLSDNEFQAIQPRQDPAAADPAPAPAPAPAKPPGFTKQASRRIGQGTRAIKYSLKIRRKIPDAYLQDFARRNTSRGDLIRIASIEPEEDRIAVCNLVGVLGIPLDEAILDITAPRGQVVEHRQTRAIPPDVPPLQETPVDAMSDDDWFKVACKDVIKRLAEPSRYKADAILYRQLRDARDEFRARTKRHLAQSKPGRRGPFHYAMCRAVNIDHPSTWLVCGACSGTGISRHMNDCPQCHGHGYSLTTVSVKREKTP